MKRRDLCRSTDPSVYIWGKPAKCLWRRSSVTCLSAQCGALRFVRPGLPSGEDRACVSQLWCHFRRDRRTGGQFSPCESEGVLLDRKGASPRRQSYVVLCSHLIGDQCWAVYSFPSGAAVWPAIVWAMAPSTSSIRSAAAARQLRAAVERCCSLSRAFTCCGGKNPLLIQVCVGLF